MRSLRPLVLTAVGFFALPLTSDAQTNTGSEITLEEAREVLGANPAAIPGYPATMRLISRAGRSVIVEQKIDSIGKLRFFEDRDGPPRARGVPEVAASEHLFNARRSYRKVGDVSVRFLSALSAAGIRVPLSPTRLAELLDRLEPIP